MAGLTCEVGTGGHGDACIGLRQRGGVVESIADHGDPCAASLQRTDGLHLVYREQRGTHLGDAGFGRHRGGGDGGIPG